MWHFIPLIHCFSVCVCPLFDETDGFIGIATIILLKRGMFGHYYKTEACEVTDHGSPMYYNIGVTGT